MGALAILCRFFSCPPRKQKTYTTAACTNKKTQALSGSNKKAKDLAPAESGERASRRPLRAQSWGNHERKKSAHLCCAQRSRGQGTALRARTGRRRRHASRCSAQRAALTEVVKDRWQREKARWAFVCCGSIWCPYSQNSKFVGGNPTRLANLYRERNEAIAGNSSSKRP